jgi:Amt family ammonium transporter
VIGPRLARDRASASPNNLLMVMAGAGLLWLGWNGFNGGDPYFSGADASAAVLNTNLCTATALLTWMTWDLLSSGKPSLVGSVNGMITGLVAITPAAGYVNGVGAIIIGVVAASIPWFTMNRLGTTLGIFKRVDDALGVIHTHGFAGLIGGLMVGLLADPQMVVYPGSGKTPGFSVTGLFYGNGHQFAVQIGAALTVIVWDGVVTFVLLRLIALVVPLRMPDAVLEEGDPVIHGEEIGLPLIPDIGPDMGHPHPVGGAAVDAMRASTITVPPPPHQS